MGRALSVTKLLPCDAPKFDPCMYEVPIVPDNPPDSASGNHWELQLALNSIFIYCRQRRRSDSSTRCRCREQPAYINIRGHADGRASSHLRPVHPIRRGVTTESGSTSQTTFTRA